VYQVYIDISQRRMVVLTHGDVSSKDARSCVANVRNKARIFAGESWTMLSDLRQCPSSIAMNEALGELERWGVGNGLTFSAHVVPELFSGMRHDSVIRQNGKALHIGRFNLMQVAEAWLEKQVQPAPVRQRPLARRPVASW
jgi:hypothetical protein